MSFSSRHGSERSGRRSPLALPARLLSAPYSVTAGQRAGRILRAPEAVQGLLSRIERYASQHGTVLQWDHDTKALREWQWQVPISFSRALSDIRVGPLTIDLPVLARMSQQAACACSWRSVR